MRTPFRTLGVAAVLAAAVAAVPFTAQADHEAFLLTWDAATAYGDSVTLTGLLQDPDDFCAGPRPCPLPGRQVDFAIDGFYVGTDVTNSGGYAYLTVDPGRDLHVGDHEITVSYDRFNRTTGISAVATATLTIVQETTITDARDGYLEAEVRDDDDAPVVGVPVRFEIPTALGPQEVCTAFTDADGNARCVGATGAGVTPLDHEATTYNAIFDGDADHVGSSDTATLL